MSSITPERTMADRASISAVTAVAPTKAAATTVICPPIAVDVPTARVTMATARLAPLVIPNTDGPAKGLRNAVCSISPATDNEAPQNTATTACGKRLCRMMNDVVSLTFPTGQPKQAPSTSNTCEGGTCVLPTNMFTTNRASIAKANATTTIRLPVACPSFTIVVC